MNAIDLYHGVTAISPALVEEAAAVRRPRSWLRYAAAAAACIAVLAVGSYQMLFKTAATIYVTINPHVSMELNRVGGVTGLAPLNADGFTLLDGYSYQNKSRMEVTEELIDRARTLGFLTDDGQVTISIEADSEKQAEKYDTEFVQRFSDDTVPVTVRELLPLSRIKSIAMEHFGLTGATLERIECDAEHDRAVYEVKLRAGTVEYECDIDAVTGQVLEAETEQAGPAAAASDLLSETEVRALALQYAEVSDAVFTECKLDDEDSAPVYELKFETDEVRYECELNAETGAILDFDAERKIAAQPAPTGGSGAAGDSEGTALLTAEQAKAAALSRAGLSDATFPLTQQITVNGVTAWQMKFYTHTGDYYCVVNAATGAIIEYEGNSRESGHEHEGSAAIGGSSAAASAAITESEARAAALARAGLSDAAFEKTELDTDDGVLVYELEFESGSWEYECKVDAATGAILEWKAETRH